MSATSEDGRLQNMIAVEKMKKNMAVPDLLKREGSGLYPNPFTDHLIIESGMERFDEVRITDILGRIYYQSETTINSGKLTIDTRSFPSGMYLISVLHKGQIISQSKAVKL